MPFKCPNGCKPETDTPFSVPNCCLPRDCEIGLLTDIDGNITNRWADGVAGVPGEVRKFAQIHVNGGCGVHCYVCGEECDWEDTEREAKKTQAKGRRGWHACEKCGGDTKSCLDGESWCPICERYQ